MVDFEGIRPAFSSSHMCLVCTPDVCNCLCTEVPFPIPDLSVSVSVSGLAEDSCFSCCYPFGTEVGNPYDDVNGSFELQAVYTSGANESFSPYCEPLSECSGATPRPFAYNASAPNYPEDPLYEMCDRGLECCGFAGLWIYGEEYINQFGQTKIRGKLINACTYQEEDYGDPACELFISETRLKVFATCQQGYGGTVSYEVESRCWCSGAPFLATSCGNGAEISDLRCVRGVKLNRNPPWGRTSISFPCEISPLTEDFTVMNQVNPLIGDCVDYDELGSFAIESTCSSGFTGTATP